LAAVVSHSIGGAREIIIGWYISMPPLVQVLQTQELRGRSGTGHCALTLPEDCRRVVGEVVDGGFPSVHIGGQDIVLSDTGGQLQIAIGDGACGVIKGDETTLHLEWKGGAPQHGLDGSIGQRDKVNAAHSWPCGILGVKSRPNGRRDQLVYARRAFSEVRGEIYEVLEDCVHFG
jgi:hypothetical protein